MRREARAGGRYWLGRVDDLSGCHGDWGESDDVFQRVRPLLDLIGRYYLPFLSANTAALVQGAEQVQLSLDGIAYRQAPFRYQGKCYALLRESYAKVEATLTDPVRALLADTGCVEWLAGDR